MSIGSLAMACGLAFGITACAGGNDAIVVVSREDGSGTRSAFIELTGIEQDDTDRTIASAEIAENTGSLTSLIAETEKAIGYASFGSVVNDESVKMISVNGVAPSAETIKSGDYAIQRPFNIAYVEDTYNSNDLLQDFVEFILSTEGQEIVSEENYIPLDNTQPYESTTTTVKELTVGGSSSVSPLMEVIIEEYEKLHTDVNIELQESDSSSGMNGAISGTLDIGMASRAVSDSELETLTGVTIATDGIAVIVNPANPCTNLTLDQICSIYIGEAVNWADVGVTFTEE